MYRNCRHGIITATLVLLSMPVMGQGQISDAEFKPFDELAISADALTNSVRHRVLYFAHFTCPYCRQAHDYLYEWGDQLPVPYEFEVVPAVGLPDHMPMALGYYVVLQLRPEKLREYEKELFRQLQDRMGDPERPDVYRAAAATVGIKEQQFDEIAVAESTKRFVERAFELTRRYGIVEVPTVVVANRFRTGPGRVYNEQQSFVALLNGLISMHYQGRSQ